MLTEKQQQIVDSLVSEFTKMNAPVSAGKKGLLNWDEIYKEKDDWEKTKAEIDLKNKAFIDNAELEMERITEMLDSEFYEHFYIYHPTNNNIKYGWTWYIVERFKHWHEATLRIQMSYRKSQVNNASETSSISRIDSLYFESSAQSSVVKVHHYSIEKLFEEKAVINKFKSYINK